MPSQPIDRTADRSSEWLAQTSTLPQSSNQQLNQQLKVVYPPADHQTSADRIFFIGSAPAEGSVTLNGKPIHRSSQGYFAPSVPLTLGENHITLRYQAPGKAPETLDLKVTRVAKTVILPSTPGFAATSLYPQVPIARQPQEWICFSALGFPGSKVSVTLTPPADSGATAATVSLAEQAQPTLPDNSAVLTHTNQPLAESSKGQYGGCTQLSDPGIYRVDYHLSPQGSRNRAAVRNEAATNKAATNEAVTNEDVTNEDVTIAAPGTIHILDPQALTIATVTAPSGTTRTGPSTDYSRLTPLPSGTQAQVTGQEGDWLRLDYGAWIKASETQTRSSTTLPHSILRSVRAVPADRWTEVVFPLQVPVPFRITQNQNGLSITLYNTIAQTDIVGISPDAALKGFSWQQTAPTAVTYTFEMGSQQWGYKTRYDGTQLILSLKHSPDVPQGIAGLRIFLDPGHGSANDLGSQGPTGYPEKDATLKLSQKLAAILRQQGAIVSLSRQGDDDIWPNDRAALIEKQEPDLAISLHYNALPDEGNAENTQGISSYWYNYSSYSLAQFLQRYIVTHLHRPSYGVFWDNLALTRPTVSPAILLELGFMINPEEFQWINDDKAQAQLASALADGIEQWFKSVQ